MTPPPTWYQDLDLNEIEIAVVTEAFDTVDIAPARALLDSWLVDDSAVAAIIAAANGTPSHFETPSGTLFLRRV